MKILLLLATLIISIQLKAACTTISRDAFADGDVLSASDLNTQFNTAYSAINSLDGECLQTSTVKDTSLDTSTLEVLLKGVKRGCEVTYSSI